MFERFTDTARRTVVLAQEEARMLNHNYVGTEHLLLALARDKAIAGQVLAEMGVTRDGARTHIVELIGEGMTLPHGHIAFTAPAKTLLMNALRVALKISHNHIGSEHLLLALAADDTSPAAQALALCGADRQAIIQRLEDLMATHEPDAGPEPHFVLSA